MNRTIGAELNSFLGELLEGGKPASIPARGFSMAPFIRDGDLITVTPSFPGKSAPGAVSQPEFKIGDLILFQTELDRWLIHRIIRRSGRGKRGRVVTKGDSLLRADRPIDLDRVWGKVGVVARESSSEQYDLGKPSIRRLMHAIALLSRMEAALFLACLSLFPSLSGSIRLKRVLRAPKWVLTKVFFH